MIGHSPNVSKLTLRRLGIAFLILASTWLIAPSLTHGLRAGPNLISEYESGVSLYGPLFRLGDALAALLLITTTFLTAPALAARWGCYVPRLIAALVLLMIMDISVPIDCRVVGQVCIIQPSAFSAVHGIESIALAALVGGLSVYLAWKHRYAYWFLVAQLVALTAGFVASRFGGDHWLFVIQAGYQLLQAYWLFGIVFDYPAAKPEFQIVDGRKAKTASAARAIIAIWVAANGLAALLLSSHHVIFGRITRPLVFAANTPWLLGHTLLVGILSLYLARHLWLGDRRAQIIAMAVLLSEVLHASLTRHGWILVPVFGLPLLVLIYYRSAFDRHGGFLGFTSRLRFTLTGVAVLVSVITLVTIGFRVHDHRSWERSPYDVGRVVRRVALLEVSADNRDSLRTVMFDRMLTLLGSSIYIWLILGIFVPRSSFDSQDNQATPEDMALALQIGSTSSEDHFKLWPNTDKRYFRTASDAIVAYAIVSGLVIALADPIRSKRAGRLRTSIGQFLTYCRAQGYKSLWLVVGPDNKAEYHAAGYSSLQIGSSARVNIATFSTKTIRNKWWRWQMNRSERTGFRYATSVAPHSKELLAQARSVSESWLLRPGHREQSFAMGYFDEAYLNACRLHCLYDADGELVAFANELPIYGGDQTTVDLIRFIPEVDGAMPVLLARTIQHLQEEGRYKYFDLGLVPLANVEGRIARLIKQFATSRFSAHGLAQFKNKFEPEWQPNYLAYDGDGIDLAKALVSLNKAMEYDPVAVEAND